MPNKADVENRCRKRKISETEKNGYALHFLLHTAGLNPGDVIFFLLSRTSNSPNGGRISSGPPEIGKLKNMLSIHRFPVDGGSLSVTTSFMQPPASARVFSPRRQNLNKSGHLQLGCSQRPFRSKWHTSHQPTGFLCEGEGTSPCWVQVMGRALRHKLGSHPLANPESRLHIALLLGMARANEPYVPWGRKFGSVLCTASPKVALL